MKTLLLATSETNRLAPLTEYIPSPMLPVLSRPVMDYSLEVLGRHKIKQVDVSLYEKPGEIEAFFGDGKHRGFELTYHLQQKALGDAGSIRWALNGTTETVLVIPADKLIDLDLEPFSEFHHAHGGGITCLAAKVAADWNSGCQPNLRVANEKIIGFDDSDDANGLVLTGVYLISPEILAKIPFRKHWEILRDLIPSLMQADLPVHVFEFDGFWNPLHTFLLYRNAVLTLTSQEEASDTDSDQSGIKYLPPEGKRIRDGVWIGRNDYLHPSVQIAPVFYLSNNSKIEKGVQVGPNVIVGNNVIVDQEATLSNAIILDHTYIGRLLNVQSKILYKNLVIDIQTGEHIAIKDQFLLTEVENERVDLGFWRIASLLALVYFLILLPIIFPVSLYLFMVGGRVISKRTCSHTDFRSFLPRSERKLHRFSLLQFQLHRKNGSFVPMGKFLERFQIHRIPELINVLRGDLAFVGVKPLCSSDDTGPINEEWQKNRFSVPLGITGLWYIRMDPNLPQDQVLVVDAYYAATRSIKRDLEIIVQTPKAWVEQIRNYRK